MAVAEGKAVTSAARSSLQAVPFRGCHPFHAAGPPRMQGAPELSAWVEQPKSAFHTERKKPGLAALAGAAASAGRPAKRAARSKLGLKMSNRASAPATGPTCNGFGPGLIRPRRGWLKVSPLTVMRMLCPVHTARTSYHVFVFTAGPRSRLSHLPSI